MTDKVSISVTVSGARHSAAVEPRLLLADFIRENLDLTGTHVGCEHGIPRRLYHPDEWRQCPVVLDARGAGRRR